MRKFTFMWFIENYSFCWHEIGEKLVSPTFVAETMQQTSWNLQLYPRGDKDADFISLYLQRCAKCNGPEKIAIDFVLSITDINGRVLKSIGMEEEEMEFRKDKGYGSSYFCQRIGNILDQNGSVLTPDILKVCCTMWIGEGKLENEARICARTRIGLEKISFINVTENFSTLIPDQKKSFQVKSASKEELKISGYVLFKNDPGFGEEVVIEIFAGSEKIYLISYKVYLLNSVGNEIEFGKIDTRNYLERKNTLKIPIYFKRKILLDKGPEYLSNDNLTLRCECIVSTGIEFQRIEETCYDLHFTPFIREKLRDPYTASRSAEPNSVSDDLRSLYKDRIVSDIQLKTVSKTFYAHKSVLCARSSVFRAMLTTDMKEKILDGIQIEDLDDNTIDQLLLFLYTDVVEDLHWESAMKLYDAADRYDVQRLKNICSSFLIARVDTCNVSDLLHLADSHQDFSLKTAVENFITMNNKKIFCTDEWEYFMEVNPHLAVKTMHLYLKNNSD
ncbi:TD and POZ domain-containing protein 3 [Argiope bruennichi]|uniref:TD and POZ domain-containing protein 3 n=1 Tax=Argiope bruennichi TaxID=94029 RepID=A0A8T0ETI1_ARGBR|nr:TD and POZ domain-containing protein 3 [Argiope bruennichi]